MTAISLRKRRGVSGLSSGPTAFTKARPPDAVTTRAATPGEKPPCWVAAETTLEPRVRSTQARTAAGIASYGVRTPTACAIRPEGRGRTAWPRVIFRASAPLWPSELRQYDGQPACLGRTPVQTAHRQLQPACSHHVDR